MDVSSSNTNTGNVEGKSVASRRMGQEKVVLIKLIIFNYFYNIFEYIKYFSLIYFHNQIHL